MEDGGLSKNDPYRAVKKSEKESVKPSFLGGDNGEKAEAASNKLSAAEEAAENKGFYKTDDDVVGAKEAEEKSEGFYSGGGGESEKTSTSVIGKLKKGGPLVALLSLITVFGTFFLGGQAMQPFGLVAEFQEVFNSMHISAQARSEKFFAFQMKSRKVKSPYNIFGTKFSISKKQQQELKKQGIDFDENYDLDGKKTKVMKFTDTDGTEKIVTADNFKKIYMENPTFFAKYNAGSMTWRGAFSNWFGTTTEKFLKSNKLTRNMFEKYKEKLEADGSSLADASPEKKKKTVVDIIKDHIKAKGELKMRSRGGDDEEAAEGSVGRGGVKSESDVREKLNGISGLVGGLGNAACGIFNFIGAVNLMVSADQALQIINLTTSLFESVDKTKAGYGDESPIMVFSDSLNKRYKTTNVVLEPTGDGKEMESVAVVRDRSAMESAGIAGLFGGGQVDPNDPSVASFNITNNLKTLAKGVGTSMIAFESCSIARAGIALISLGTGGIVKKIEAAFAIGVSTVASLMLPVVANAMMRDIVETLAGEDYGNAITLGANLYLGSTHRANGGSLATMEKYESFAIEQEKVIAENARFERENLSPFDATSKYTFMGTLFNRMMGFSHANSIMSTLTASGSVVSSSLASLAGTATAYDLTARLPDSMEEYEETCPYLASIGAVGDSYCNPYVVTDMGTIDKDPDDVLEKVKGYGGFSNDSGDNVEIDSNSDLAKYIRYCDNRQSAFGIADQNIVGEVAGTFDVNTSNSTFNAVMNTTIGMIPYVGDAIDIIQSVEEMAYVGYISGESCVAGNDVEAASSPNWSKAKYYQRFIEDQSLAESMGLIEKSAVTAYLEDYYKENPLDNSYEGILARYSGLDKDTVVAILDVMEYESYIANYDPSDRYVFGEEAEEDETIFSQERLMDGEAVMLGQFVYADVRNRYFMI